MPSDAYAPTMPHRMRVFISSRSDDSPGHAGRLSDQLVTRYGADSVVLGVDPIEGGDPVHAIGPAIATTDAVLVVIGPGWVGARDATDRRRLDDLADPIRLAIETALERSVRTIPVLVGGASMPTPEELPPSIVELARRNAVELQDRRWREDVDALVEILEGRGRGRQGNLPVQPTPFLGRERELGDLAELLPREDVRLITLTGPGGIGKTRLAIQTAKMLAHTYSGGAWFVGLAAIAEPALVLPEIARVLGIPDAPEGRLVVAIAERLARRRTLLMLDNVEQLLPEIATPIAELLAAAPSLEVIASSRERLRLAAEREYPVPLLSTTEAVAMFVDRASAVVPGFAPGDGPDREVIAAICERLDRLPLAIELAAARIRLFGPAELLGRLEQRLPMLTGGARDAPEHQRTIRATIAWSYELLSPDERELFERLSVFSGGWDVEAAQAVCDADLDALQSLSERNLVRRVAGPGGRSRSAMLATIHEFALELLELRPDEEELRRRHAEHLSRIAEGARLGILGPDQSSWLDRIEAELDNFRSALRWSLDGRDPDLALGITVGIAFHWFVRGPLSEGRRWLGEALEKSSPQATWTRAWALDWAGFLAGEQGERAAETLEESIRCAREAGDPAIEAIAMSHLSGQLPPARADEMVPLAREAVRIARGSGEDWCLSPTLINLGESLREVGDHQGALAAYEEGLRLRRKLGESALTAVTLANMAELEVVAGNLERAFDLAQESIDVSSALGDMRHAASARSALGWIALARGDLSDAATDLAASLELAEEMEDAPASVVVLFGFAGVAAANGDAARAARLYAAATRHEDLIGHRPSPADAGIHRRLLAELRKATDPETWSVAAREGEEMSLEDATAYALHRQPQGGRMRER
jgi:predicted ATPase